LIRKIPRWNKTGPGGDAIAGRVHGFCLTLKYV
jgi:hypothetical protein